MNVNEENISKKHCTKSTFYAMFEQKGITLIALIITIIVLLILGGVTISNITGGNSTIEKAEQAKDETAIQAELQEIQSAIANVSGQSVKQGDFSGNIDTNAIKSALEKYVTDTSEITGNGPWQVISSKTGAEYAITPNCEVKRIMSDKIGVYTKMGVQKGDYVNYSAGNWTQEDIDKLKNLYSGENIPDSTNPYTFGGFKVGQSKDIGIIQGENNEAIQDNEHAGWRVLEMNDDGSIKIIHAGAPEQYYHPTYYYGSGNRSAPQSASRSQYILEGTKIEGVEEIAYDNIAPRNWSMYENQIYAIHNSARSIRRIELIASNGSYAPGNQWNRIIGISFWTTQGYLSGGGVFVCDISSDKTRAGVNNYSRNASNGIRPVVTLKAECLFQDVNDENTTTHDTQETAWNLVI